MNVTSLDSWSRDHHIRKFDICHVTNRLITSHPANYKVSSIISILFIIDFVLVILNFLIELYFVQKIN